jgi:competence protein ComEC
MALERVELFSHKKEFFSFLLLCSFILFYSFLIEYQNYKNFTRFDSTLVDARVLKQYQKTKNSKKYQVLKLRTDNGTTFYSKVKKSFLDVNGKSIYLEVWAGKISFYDYLTSFYAHSKVISIKEQKSLKERLNYLISAQHQNRDITNIYQALFSATPLSRDLQSKFSSLGISHLLAISGFHLGILSALLFFLFKMPYSFLQNRFFPYRNAKSDIFLVISSILLLYLLFLDTPPSLLRAFSMLIIGFILYDRGIKIISMQTLLVTSILLLSFFVKLFFSLGFWLSIAGVFYIFLFLIHFKHLSKLWQFVLIPIWVYMMMLPFSLAIFTNFSIYHPLSIIWSTLFSIFYPVSIFLHLIGHGNLLDSLLETLLSLPQNTIHIELELRWLILHILMSLASIKYKKTIFLLMLFSMFIFMQSVFLVWIQSL